MKIVKTPGTICLAAYLILAGLPALIPALSLGIVVPILGIVAGVLLLVGK